MHFKKPDEDDSDDDSSGDKAKAARKVKRAADDLDEAADEVDNAGQKRHIEDLAEEAEKTGKVLEDQAQTEQEE